MLLLPVAAAAMLSGCGAVSDDDIAARFGDVEYTHDQLTADLEAEGYTPEQRADAELLRNELTSWVVAQSAAETGASDAYNGGLPDGGSLCLALIITDTEAAASAALTALESGTNFDEVFAANNIDPSLDPDSGRVGCSSSDQLPPVGDNPLVDSVLGTNASNPYGTATLPNAGPTGDLYSVSRFVPFDELNNVEQLFVFESLGLDPESASPEALGLDVFIDPRIGNYDTATRTVIALG